MVVTKGRSTDVVSFEAMFSKIADRAMKKRKFLEIFRDKDMRQLVKRILTPEEDRLRVKP